MRVYVTKYALTRGILEMNVEPTSFPNMVKTAYDMFHAGEWFTSMDDAMANAEDRIARRLASLRKTIAKLDGKPIKVKLLSEGNP